MANRGYLYSIDYEFPQEYEWNWHDHKDQYYDSRWDIPFSWFFFYHKEDIVMTNVVFNGGYWQEVKLVASREVALETFEARIPLLESIVGPLYDADRIQTFIETLRNRRGQYLVVDPHWVVYDDDPIAYQRFTEILELIESRPPDITKIREAINRYSQVDLRDTNDFILYVIGYTYGD